jgi:hypothetical protein
MSLPLALAPSFRVVRTQSGSVAVDSSTLSLANYPMDQQLDPAGADEIVFYWQQTGGNTTDTINVQALTYDVVNARYVTGETVSSVALETVTTIRVYGARFQLRVAAKTSTGTDLRMLAAAVYQSPTRRS